MSNDELPKMRVIHLTFLLGTLFFPLRLFSHHFTEVRYHTFSSGDVIPFPQNH